MPEIVNTVNTNNKKDEFYSVLYYFEKRIVWIYLTFENVSYYFFN
jgi:hypothetical protein